MRMLVFFPERQRMRGPNGSSEIAGAGSPARSTSTHPARTCTRGFTLLEVLVVLVIVSATAAIVFPQLTTMADAVEFALEREKFEQTLNALSYQAFRENQPMVLAGTYTDAGRDAETQPGQRSGGTLRANLRTLPVNGEEREYLPPLNLAFPAPPLPEGWLVTVDAPIYFQGSGYCTGGNIELFIGDLQYSYVMTPPLCRAVLVE